MRAGWIAFVCIIDVVGLLVLIGLLIKRNHNFIRFRNFPLLFIQIVGLLTAINLASFYLGRKPDFSCYAKYTMNLLAFAGFAFPFTIRCWEYGVNFHIAKARTKFRQGEKLNNWFIHNRWCVMPKLLLVVFSVGFFVWFIPLIPYIVKATSEYNYTPEEDCHDAAGSKYVVILFFILFVLMAFFLAYLMYGSKDVFYVKAELIGMAVTWAAILLIWLPWGFTVSDSVKLQVPTTFWINMGFTISVFWNGIFPLILVFKFPDTGKLSVGSETYTVFLSQLAEIQFRNRFHDYMVRQFCQENLIFYEVATEWKTNNRRSSQARFIYENFISVNSVCQINISQAQSAAIQQGLTHEEVSPTIFDDALRAITDMMYANSYILFTKQKERSESMAGVTLSSV